MLSESSLVSGMNFWQVHFAATQAALRVHFGGCGYVNRVTLLVEPATGKPKGLVECNVYYELLDTLYLLNCSCCIMYPLEGPCKTVRIFMILSLRCVLADLLLWNLLQRMQ